MEYVIPFNKPTIVGSEIEYISDAVSRGKISGDGYYTRRCHMVFESKFGFKKALLTTSCTDALEMAAILLNLREGDEVILPSYTFVSTANAFLLRGAKLVFCDSAPDSPNIDPSKIEELITSRTKAIVVVHYAGVACDMDRIMRAADMVGALVIEDAAQAIASYYKGRPLGGIGAIGAFSFHETKNINCGEGGLIAVNNESFHARSEIIREKGTNRSAFFRGEVDKYGWVDLGSSFLPSDLNAAFLYAQLENLDQIQRKRIALWDRYRSGLESISLAGNFKLPEIPDWATNNAHMFYIIMPSLDSRSRLIEWLKAKGIHAVFHYLPLHESVYFKGIHDGRELVNANYYADSVLRLPLYYSLSVDEVDYICEKIRDFFK